VKFNFKIPENRSRKKPGKLSRGCSILFFIPFLLAGLAMMYFIIWRPIQGSIRARSWIETPCVVTVSTVDIHDGDDGNTYKVHIEYDYFVNDQKYHSNRYEFFDVASSGRSGKEEVVSQFPVGDKALCYVNPDNPEAAVIYRDIHWWLFPLALFPLIFIAVGAGGIIYGVKTWNKADAPLSELAALNKADYLPKWKARPSEPVTLKASFSRWGKVVVIILAAVFWNGIVSVFVMNAAKAWQSGRPEWFLMIFLIPFVAVGLFLAAMIVHQFLAAFNPRPVLTINSDAVRAGQPLDVGWDLLGKAGKITAFSITLVGTESASYRRGTRTVTDDKVFAEIPVVTTTREMEMIGGTATLAIPDDVMHSFIGKSNKITWALKVKGDIPRWPDIDETFSIVILPASFKMEVAR